MSLRETLVRNTFWYGVVTVLGIVSGLIMSVVLARGLGPARMGDYSFVLWAWRTLTAVATLGFGLATVRYTASALAGDDAGLAGGFVRLFLRRQVLATTVVVLVVAPLSYWIAPVDLRWAYVVVALGLFPISIEAIYTYAVQGAQRYDLTTRTSAVKMTLHLLASIAAVALGGDILGLVVGISVGNSVACLVQRRSAQTLYTEDPKPVPATALPDIRAYLVPLSVVAVLDVLVWERSEMFFLRLYTSSEAIAFYSLAFGLATRAMMLPEIAGGALLPTMSALHRQGAAAEFARVYQNGLRYVALLGAPIAAVGTAVAPGVITFLYGEAYLPAAALLGVLGWVGLLSAMRKVAWTALRAAGDRRVALSATWLGVVVNVGTAALLIPSRGMWGAVAASTGAQLLASVWAFVALARVHGTGFPAGDLVRIAGAAALTWATSAAIVAGGSDLPRVAVAGVAGLTTFAILAVLTGVVGPREWALLAAVRRRIQPGRGAARAAG